MRISDWSSDVCSSDLKDSGKLGVDRKTEHAKYPVQTCALYGQVGIAAHQPGHLLVAPGGGLDGPFGNVQPGQDQRHIGSGACRQEAKIMALAAAGIQATDGRAGRRIKPNPYIGRPPCWERG